MYRSPCTATKPNKLNLQPALPNRLPSQPVHRSQVFSPPPAAPVAHPQALQKAVKQMANKAGTEGLVHGIKNPELRKVGLVPGRP